MEVEVCVSANNEIIGSRSISLSEYLENQKWTCQGSPDCPERLKCNTIKSH